MKTIYHPQSSSNWPHCNPLRLAIKDEILLYKETGYYDSEFNELQICNQRKQQQPHPQIAYIT